MEPVIYKNGEFMEIVIPANTELTSEMLLSKYGIHADVKFVDDPMTGGGTLTYPYAFFHWFFSIFSLRQNVKDTSKDKTTVGTKDVNPNNVDTLNTKDNTEDAIPNVKESKGIDMTLNTKDETEDAIPNVKKSNDVDETHIVKSTNDSKYMKITIHSIDGVRSW